MFQEFQNYFTFCPPNTTCVTSKPPFPSGKAGAWTNQHFPMLSLFRELPAICTEDIFHSNLLVVLGQMSSEVLCLHQLLTHANIFLQLFHMHAVPHPISFL